MNIPFAEKQPVSYVWLYKGKEAARTRFTWEKVHTVGQGRGIRVVSQLRYSAMGRQLRADAIAILDEDLQPRIYHLEYHIHTAPQMDAAFVVDVTLSEKFIHITKVPLGNPDKRMTQDIPRQNPCYLYEKHGFEWLVFSVLALPAQDAATLHFVEPFDMTSIDVKFHNEGLEKTDDGELMHWSLLGPQFKAELWTKKNGELERYRQGDLEIFRSR